MGIYVLVAEQSLDMGYVVGRGGYWSSRDFDVREGFVAHRSMFQKRFEH
jgi:hypothetical protein